MSKNCSRSIILSDGGYYRKHCFLFRKVHDVADMYRSRMEQLGIKLDARVNTTSLKERLFAQFPDLQAQTESGGALTKSCEWGSDIDAVHLGHAAKCVRRHMFDELSLDSKKAAKETLCRAYCWHW